MGDDHVETYTRKRDPGNSREWTLASLVGAAALAWSITGAWTGFRDGVLVQLSDCAHRYELLVTRVEGLGFALDSGSDRVGLLERKHEQSAADLQALKERVRDLERGAGIK